MLQQAPAGPNVVDLKFRERALEARAAALSDRAERAALEGNRRAMPMFANVREAYGQAIAAVGQARVAPEVSRTHLVAISDCYAQVGERLAALAGLR